jgi:hypothetical protein
LDTLLDAVRSNWGYAWEEDYDEPSIGFSTAYTGIVSTLLRLGHTFHSMVKAPCTNLNAESCFPLSPGSDPAQVIIDTNVFDCDEVSMAHAHLTTGLDRLFKDLMQYDRPFGGKLVVTSGVFIHNLPITPGG